MDKYRTVEGDTLDLIAWNFYESTSGAVESILEANQGLSKYGAILPSGLIINLPAEPAAKQNEVVRLWD